MNDRVGRAGERLFEHTIDQIRLLDLHLARTQQALDGVRQCLDEGIPVHSYLYWSLLDNFEWTSGYGVHFGLAAVDRATFRRTLKPSALHLGAIARANRI